MIFLLNERDRPVPPDIERRMVANMPNFAELVHLDTAHIAYVVVPERFAAIVSAAAG